MEENNIYLDPNIEPQKEMLYIYHETINPHFYPHYHPYYELTFVTKGSIIVDVNGKKILMEDGCLLLLRPNDLHSKIDIGDCKHIVLIVFKTAMEELFHYLGVSSYLTTLLDMTIPPFVTLSSYDKTRLEQDLYKLNAIPIYNLELINMNLRKLLLNVMSSYFFSLLNIGDTEPNIPLWLHPYLEKLKEKENLCQGLHYLYESIPMSKSHICRIFKQYLHMTPTEYVNDMRLNYAANLLANSSEEIIDICEEVGFASLSNFYHVFRKKFGDSPMKFRNNHKYKIDIKAEE